MATKKRFSTHKFCAAWQKHGPTSSVWDEFVEKMRTAAGDEEYPEDEIERRLNLYKDQNKGKNKVPKYPAPRTPSSVAYFSRN